MLNETSVPTPEEPADEGDDKPDDDEGNGEGDESEL